jgi:hypothetical protein
MSETKIQPGDWVWITLDEDRLYYHLHAGQKVLGQVIEIFSITPFKGKGAKIRIEKISGLEGPQSLQIFSEEWQTAIKVPKLL